MDRTSHLSQALSKAGYRLTPQRLAICKLLAQSNDHPTAQVIYEILKPDYPSLSLATVYNTLDSLVQLGAVNALGSAGDDAVHYDADTKPHVNLACISCHRVVDLHSEHISHLEDEVTSSSGFQLLGARVLYYGVCPSCQMEERKVDYAQI
ncbi:MAG: transcriptional repressor [Anaerolineales bacterium]|nr:transcriptional repressor [Anaerolineales bacterium]